MSAPPRAGAAPFAPAPARSRISTTRPSPRSVAPAMPSTRISGSAIARTTISRWPTIRSTAMPTASLPGADHERREARARALPGCRTAGQAARPAARRRGTAAISWSSTARSDAGSTSMTSRTDALRHGERPIADVGDQRVGDRQRQRQLDHEARAAARLGLKRERAAQLLDRRLHHRHADAAAAGAVGLVARRESRRADQIEQRGGVERPLGHRQTGRAGARAPPPRHRCRGRRRRSRCTTTRRRSTPPSVSVPSARLAGGQPLRRRFEAVADGVAHQVQDRIHHPLDQELVDLGVLPAQLEPHLRLPVSRARSRTTNGMRRKISPTGTSRTRITPSRRSAQLPLDRLRCSPGPRATRRRARGARRAPACPSSRARLITSRRSSASARRAGRDRPAR